MKGLLKRISGRRKEHLCHRQEDSQKLLLRNKNVMHGLETKQTQFQKTQLAKTNEALQPPRYNRSKLEKISMNKPRNTTTA